MERYGHGTPDDWVERNVYARSSVWGLWLMGAINIALFGLIPGLLILLAQIVWIPFWAAGVINGIGHWFGYRSWDVPAPDASRNIVPVGMLIGGEELHNNHHAFPASARFSIEVVRVRHRLDVHLHPRGARPGHGEEGGAQAALRAPKAAADFDTLHAVIANRYDVLSRYAKSMKRTYAEEMAAPARTGRRATPKCCAR